MRHGIPLVALALTACFPTTRQETGLNCWSLTNGDAETAGPSTWKTDPPEAGAAVTEQDQSDGIVTPQEGSWFFSMALAAAERVTMTHACSPAPTAKACTVSGWYQTEGLGENPDEAKVLVVYRDDAGAILTETASEPHSTASGAWQHFELRAEIPEGAGEIDVVLEGTLGHGDMVNVFWDDLELSCSDGVTGAS
jgi:hypothetical protein